LRTMLNPSNSNAQLVLLGSITYGASTQYATQNFTLPIEASHVEVEYVVVEVTSNWGGEGGSTCLYRIRLYGQMSS
jgi:hypothetical protein